MKTTLFYRICNWWYAKRYHLYKQVSINNVEVFYYWKLKKSVVSDKCIRLNIKKYRNNSNERKLQINEELRKYLALRIKRKTK